MTFERSFKRIELMKKLIITMFLFAGYVSYGQERLTLQDAIAKALEYNFDIRVANVVAQQAEVNNTIGNAGMLPDINATGGVNVGSTNSHIEFADGRIQERNGARSMAYNGAVNLNWTLFDGGRMFLLKRQLNMQEELAQVQLKEQVQRTVSQVIQAYAQVVFQHQQGVAIDTGLALAKIRMMLSQVKFETGASAKVDFLQARVDYNARQSDSLGQESAVNSSVAMLNLMMGEDPFKSYIVDDSLRSDLGLQPTDRQTLQGVNLTVDIARRNADISRVNSRIARTFHLPTLDLNGGYNYNYSKSEAGFALFNRTSGPSGGLSLNMPLFQGGNIRRQARVASLQAMRNELLYHRQNTELGRQYRTAWRNYEVAVAAYKLEQENIRYAKENLDIQRARFRVGIATTLETREAENSYVQALVRFYTAAYNVKVSETLVLEIENELVK